MTFAIFGERGAAKMVYENERFFRCARNQGKKFKDDKNFWEEEASNY